MQFDKPSFGVACEFALKLGGKAKPEWPITLVVARVRDKAYRVIVGRAVNEDETVEAVLVSTPIPLTNCRTVTEVPL